MYKCICQIINKYQLVKRGGCGDTEPKSLIQTFLAVCLRTWYKSHWNQQKGLYWLRWASIRP